MSYFMIDVESDGPIPGDYSMISIGAVLVHPDLDQTFYGEISPISDKWVPEALAVSGFSRVQTLGFSDPKTVMERLETWIKDTNKVGRPMFISDNNGYDWMFACWYFHHFLGRNPFGFSSTNLGSLYKGIVQNTHKNFKHLRKTPHTHNPVDDAKGNAEAFIFMVQNMDLSI